MSKKLLLTSMICLTIPSLLFGMAQVPTAATNAVATRAGELISSRVGELIPTALIPYQAGELTPSRVGKLIPTALIPYQAKELTPSHVGKLIPSIYQQAPTMTSTEFTSKLNPAIVQQIAKTPMYLINASNPNPKLLAATTTKTPFLRQLEKEIQNKIKTYVEHEQAMNLSRLLKQQHIQETLNNSILGWSDSLNYAMSKNQNKLVEILIRYGAPIDSYTINNLRNLQTILPKNDFSKMLNVFASENAVKAMSMDAQNDFFKYLVETDNFPMIEKLLKKGIKPVHLLNNKFSTAVDYRTLMPEQEEIPEQEEMIVDYQNLTPEEEFEFSEYNGKGTFNKKRLLTGGAAAAGLGAAGLAYGLTKKESEDSDVKDSDMLVTPVDTELMIPEKNSEQQRSQLPIEKLLYTQLSDIDASTVSPEKINSRFETIAASLKNFKNYAFEQMSLSNLFERSKTYLKNLQLTLKFFKTLEKYNLLTNKSFDQEILFPIVKYRLWNNAEFMQFIKRNLQPITWQNVGQWTARMQSKVGQTIKTVAPEFYDFIQTGIKNAQALKTYIARFDDEYDQNTSAQSDESKLTKSDESKLIKSLKPSMSDLIERFE